jgi:hypothetical protein
MKNSRIIRALGALGFLSAFYGVAQPALADGSVSSLHMG